jgi:hypothetical protein
LHGEANHPSALRIDSPISVWSDYTSINQEMKPMHGIITIAVCLKNVKQENIKK